MSEGGEGEMVRGFFALEPEGEAVAFLKKQRSELKRAMPEAPIRWVRPENLHLTLRFLGELESEVVDELREDAERTLGGWSAFSFQMGSPMLFPNRGRPVVIATAVEASEKLTRLAETLERSALRCGLGGDRFAFHPHITLGRFKRGTRIRRLPESTDERADCQVNEVVLMRSELSGSGPAYSPIQTFRFGRT